MDKGKGAKGNGKGGQGRGFPSRQIGTHAYLKNYRKGLRHQTERAQEDSETLRNTSRFAAAHDRLQWTFQKQYEYNFLWFRGYIKYKFQINKTKIKWTDVKSDE